MRLPLLILASLLSLYASWWFLTRITMDALMFQSGIVAFAFASVKLICGVAALGGIAQGWRSRNRTGAAGEALLGFILMLGFLLFMYLLGVAGKYF